MQRTIKNCYKHDCIGRKCIQIAVTTFYGEAIRVNCYVSVPLQIPLRCKCSFASRWVGSSQRERKAISSRAMNMDDDEYTVGWVVEEWLDGHMAYGGKWFMRRNGFYGTSVNSWVVCKLIPANWTHSQLFDEK